MAVDRHVIVQFKGLDRKAFARIIRHYLAARNDRGYDPRESWVPFIRGEEFE